MRGVAAAAVAGATGSTALNIVAYGDMALRGRPPSRVPDAVVHRIAARFGVALGDHRAEGLGMLLGYADGFAFGFGYALLRAVRPLRSVPWPAGGAALALATFAPELVAARLGATDLRRWGVVGWLEGLAPRLAYGFVTAAAYEAFGG